LVVETNPNTASLHMQEKGCVQLPFDIMVLWLIS